MPGLSSATNVISTPRGGRRWLSATLAVGLALLVSVAAPPTAAIAGQNASITLSKTVDRASFLPTVSLSLTRDRDTAIPGDTIGYSTKVTSTGATESLGGTFTAVSASAVSGTVVSWYDDVEYFSPHSNSWTVLAAGGASAAGWAPVSPTPSAQTALTVTATGRSATGVTYPSAGDGIVGTTLAPGVSAVWTYAATATLTPAQVAVLADPKQTNAVRNVVHYEVSPKDAKLGQPYISRVGFTNPFQTRSSSVTGCKVTIISPDGSQAVVDSSKVSGLASLASGQSVSVPTSWKVPVLAPRTSDESQTDYLARLGAANGSALKASASVACASGASIVTASAAPVSTTENLPVLTISKSGPAQAGAGTTATYPLALANGGGAPASALTVTDTVPAGQNGTVTGTPTTLAPGGTATSTATYPIPASQPSGPLTDTATLRWADGHGNQYGPVTSSFDTAVSSTYAGAALTLSPESAGPDVVGASQRLTATLVDAAGRPIPNAPLTITVTGANPTTGQVTTGPDGAGVFTYTGAVTGDDIARAALSSPGSSTESNTARIAWTVPIAPVSVGTVHGRFFTESSAVSTFVATKSDVPAFGQDFPTIAFDPSKDLVPHDITGVGPTTRPFTDVTTDVNGNGIGSLVAAGNGHEAGSGDMQQFNAVFTSTFVVANPGDVTLTLNYDTSFVLGIGGGATRVSGSYEAPPATGTTAFEGYPAVGTDNVGTARTSVAATKVVVHFPAPGTYPFELDYAEGHGGPLSLVLGVGSVVADATPLSVYAGYADGLRPGGSIFPFPWNGSSNTVFVGCPGSGCQFDGGAVRLDNTTGGPVTVNSATVDIGSCRFAIWPADTVVPNGASAIFTQMISGANSGCPNDGSFDTSDAPYITCTPTGLIPHITLVVDGVTHGYDDAGQVLNTKGTDSASCPGGNESRPWTRISGGDVTTVDHPLPPAALLRLNAAGQSGQDTSSGDTVSNTVGSPQRLSVSAMDASGTALGNLTVDVAVGGANATTLHGTTTSAGILDLAYTGLAEGTDRVSAGAFITGQRTVSGEIDVAWSLPAGTAPDPANPGRTLPAPPPVIASLAPLDGQRVTIPTPITAAFTPPAGESLTSWKVTYQDIDPGPEVTLASGTGAPPSTLATFDPTLLPNDTYIIRVSATSSGGGLQSASTTVTVGGNLKLGRYAASYQDMTAVVDGYTMQVRRTYDSTDKRVGDFGVGWKVDVVNFRTAANRDLGAGGWSQYAKQCAWGFCLMGLRTSSPHFVSVTYPDGRQDIFDLTPEGGSNIFWSGTAGYTARAGLGITDTLQPLGDPTVSYTGDGNLYAGITPGTVYAPTRFQLTTATGTVLILDTATGLVSQTDPQGRSLSVDTTGVHSSSGLSLTFTRDAQGRISDVTGPATGQQVHYGIDANGDLATVTDALNHPVTYGYDGNHDLKSVTGPGAVPFTTISYYPDGRVRSVTDGDGHVTTLADNVAARQQSVTDAARKLTTISSFDELGDLTRKDQVFDGRTVTSRFAYDPVGRPTSVTDPLGHVSTSTYDGDGNLATYTDPDHRTWTYTWNKPGQLANVVGPDNIFLSHLTYNGTGSLTDVEQADHSHRTYTYAGAHLQTATDAGGRAFTFGYDGSGRVNSIADQRGGTVAFEKDAAGQVTSVTDQTQATTNYGYDAVGNLTTVTDVNHNATSYGYDANDRVHTVTDALGHSDVVDYTPGGLVSQTTDRAGVTVVRSHDDDSRLTQLTFPDGSAVSYGYDPLGRVTTASTPTSTVTLGWDDASRLQSDHTVGTGAVAGLDVTSAYSYTDAGRRASLTGPEGVTGYAYQPLGMTVNAAGGGLFAVAWDSPKPHLSTLARPNGVTSTTAWDASGDLTSSVSTAAGGAVVASSTFVPDPVTGWTQTATDLGGATSYTHDSRGQLTSVTPPAGAGSAQSYAYDPVGSLTQWPGTPAGSAVIDAVNRLSADGRYTYGYDNEGRRLTRTARSDGSVSSYTWNPLGQLTGVSGAGHTSGYVYDAVGRRIQTTVDGVVTRFGYDASSVHVELDAGNHVIAALTTTGSLGAPLQVRRGSTLTYPLTDGRGTVTALTDATGGVTGRYTFDGYGVPSATNPAEVSATFTGQRFDPATGLYQLRARYYDPGSGRFLSQDPVGGVNAYRYANGNPSDLADPSGLAAAAEEGELAGAIAGAVNAAAPVEGEAALAVVSGAESSIADVAVGETEAAATEAGNTGGAGVVRLGQAGEDAVRGVYDIGGKATRTIGGRARIFDGLNDEAVSEVKNVARQAYTQQLKDSLAYAEGNGLRFDFYARPDTYLTGPLRDAIGSNPLFNLRFIP